ncbi:thiamine phosphate synthase [Ramlibacter tataouinensis]|uniref:thiamine phosphate synthase n=1 Tax=Ramlibacter tataouinensis TaxID=94132 RepID=UPI0022F3F88E|nr:thiamine phosphate synthase [Ramlibacter tataouinensis]WBY02274.1 thiamine phosphate synthase [Ramlibacter tataouinensis]
MPLEANSDPRQPVRVVDPAAGVEPVEQAGRLRAEGAAAVLVQAAAGGSDDPTLHWLDSSHARGWVRSAAPTNADTLERAWEAQRGQGHVAADALLLAFGALPLLSWGEAPPEPLRPPTAEGAPLGIYAIVDSALRVRQVLEAGVRTVQLRLKRPADADARWQAVLAAAVRESVAAARDHGARLFINDHWRLAAELGATAVHLGQEDLLALGETGRAELRACGLALGISSHAVWELCRARALAPAYVACGPVWPTTTKDMPWRPQGLDNLAWWARVAGTPVVAIGGILDAAQVREAARAGADGVCVLRGLGDDPMRVVPALQKAFERGRSERAAASAPALPHPTLEPQP